MIFLVYEIVNQNDLPPLVNQSYLRIQYAPFQIESSIDV